MYARVARYQGSPQQIEQGLQTFRQSRQQLQQMQGFKKAYLLIDRQTGKGVSVTLWESEEAMRQSDAAARQIRSQGAQAMGGTISEAELYEVAEEI